MPIFGEKHPFTRTNVELAPDAHGVYALYGENEVAFYGVARGEDTLRGCLALHLWGRQQPGREETKRFAFEVTRFPMARTLALLEEHRRSNRRLPPYNEPPPGSCLLPQTAHSA